jgi:hypothetical protein
VAHEIGHEEDGALEDADQQEILAGVVGRDLGSKLGDAFPQRVLLDQDLGNALLDLSLERTQLLLPRPR